MDELIETIRAAIASDTTPEAKAAGADACRTILAALEAEVGEPIAPVMPPMAQVATMIRALRGVPPDQLLDLAIARLRAALPPDAVAPTVSPLKLPLIQLPRTSR